MDKIEKSPQSTDFARRRVRVVAWFALAVLLWAGFGVFSLLASINTDSSPQDRRSERYGSHRMEFADQSYARGGREPVTRGYPSRNAEPIEVQDRDPDLAKADALAEELSRRISEHDSLPRESLLGSIGLSVLANDQKNNNIAMSKILDALATEIGATKAAGAIRIIQENREKQVEQEGLAKSEDPTIRGKAEGALERILQENRMLEEFVRQSFSNEGVELSEEQVRSLCASPNAEDTASMISAFGALKAIAAKMEDRLRRIPSQEQAQKYYGSHYAMLLALNKIQTKAMQNIRDIYLPAADKIRQEAARTSEEAGTLLARRDLSADEEQALRWNVVSCNKTVETASNTRKKLEKNLEIISGAQEKLANSLAAAKNCHTTAMLQKQILWLEGTALQEFQRIEALTIPPLAAVNFADPENPEVSPPKKPLM